jgi:hypothetical protein
VLSRFRVSLLFSRIGQQGHIAGPFDRVLDGALKGGTGAGALPAIEFALRGAKFLEALHVFKIHVCRPRATLFGTKPAPVLSTSPKLLSDHGSICLYQFALVRATQEVIKLAAAAASVNAGSTKAAAGKFGV